MSREHVQLYYNRLLADYLEMREMTQEASKLFDEGRVTQEQIDNLRTLFTPVELAYKQISQIMYELNKPSNPKKLTRYEKRMENAMRRLDKNDEFSLANRLEANRKVLLEQNKRMDELKGQSKLQITENDTEAWEEEQQKEKAALDLIEQGLDEIIVSKFGFWDYGRYMLLYKKLHQSDSEGVDLDKPLEGQISMFD